MSWFRADGGRVTSSRLNCVKQVAQCAFAAITNQLAFIDWTTERRYGVDGSMALNIRNPEAERLAAELARLTGETKTEAVINALRDCLARIRRESSKRSLVDELEDIAEHCASLPVLDARPADEILGYDEHGISR